jgi:uncharacterized protein DUF4124
MYLAKGLTFTLLLLPIFGAYADIYRCVDESGRMNFKDHPCQLGLSNSKQDKIELKQMNVLERNEQVESYQQGVRLRSESTVEIPQLKAEGEIIKKKTNCMAAKRNYKREAKLVKARCAKARDVFCDLAAEEIQFKWDWNFARRATDQQVRNIQKNGAAIYQLKKVMDNDCRY